MCILQYALWPLISCETTCSNTTNLFTWIGVPQYNKVSGEVYNLTKKNTPTASIYLFGFDFTRNGVNLRGLFELDNLTKNNVKRQAMLYIRHGKRLC